MDDESGELGERRVEQASLGAVGVGVDRGAVVGVTRVDDMPGLAFEDQLGWVTDEVEQGRRQRERPRPPPRCELSCTQLTQCYEVFFGAVADHGPRHEALARVVDPPAPFDRVQHCVDKQLVRVLLKDVAPDAECNRGRLRWQELSPAWVERCHRERTGWLFVEEERVRGDAGGLRPGAAREPDAVFSVGREA
jgi:hypothetical protein